MSDSEFSVELVQGSIKSAMKNAGATSFHAWRVDPRKVQVLQGFNVRDDTEKRKAHVRRIADLIKSEGYHDGQPLEGFVDSSGNIFVTGGHCRLEATLIAISEGCEIETVPMVAASPGTNMEDLTVALVTGNSGEPLSPYETGTVCKRLIRFGWSESKIAAKLGFGTQYVKGLLLLVAAPLEIRNAVIDDLISASEAIRLLTEHGGQAVELLQLAQAKAAVSGKTHITKKDTDPQVKFNNAVKKYANELYDMLNTVLESDRQDEVYGRFQEIRAELEALK